MQRLLKSIYGSPRLTLALKTVSYAAVAASALVYLLLLYLAYVESEDGMLEAVKLLLVSGVPFVTVSLLRKLIDAPRPYEIYGFYDVKPKDKAGRSFPSRHVFSAFMIASLTAPYSAMLSVMLFLLGAALAAARVLLGIHFVRDVVAGALVGMIFGALGVIII